MPMSGDGKMALSGTVMGGPPVCPTMVTVPSETKKLWGPALPGAIYQFSMSIRRPCAPLSGGVSDIRCSHWVKVASPTPPESNSIQPHPPPRTSQKEGLLQLKDAPICHMAVLPYA